MGNNLSPEDLDNLKIEFLSMQGQLNAALEENKALKFLLVAEKILEVNFLFRIFFFKFAANCGRSLDRNLIIVILYNRSCAY